MAAAQAAVMCAASLALLLARPGGMKWTHQLVTLGTPAWTALLYLGLLASVVVVTLQAWGQQRVDAMHRISSVPSACQGYCGGQVFSGSSIGFLIAD